MLDAIFRLDTAVLLYVHEHVRCPALDLLLVPLSRMGDMGIVWIILCVILLFRKRTRLTGLMALSALAAECISCELIMKRLFMRTRPFLALEQIVLLVPLETSASFPSGHSASSFACAYILCRQFGRKGAWAYLPAGLIALSRIYVGAHYPTDVLGGALFGTAVAAAVYALWQYFLKRKGSGSQSETRP